MWVLVAEKLVGRTAVSLKQRFLSNLVHNLHRFAFLSTEQQDKLRKGAEPDQRRMGRKLTRAPAPAPPPAPPPSPSTPGPLVTISAGQHSALLAALQAGCRSYLRGLGGCASS